MKFLPEGDRRVDRVQMAILVIIPLVFGGAVALIAYQDKPDTVNQYWGAAEAQYDLDDLRHDVWRAYDSAYEDVLEAYGDHLDSYEVAKAAYGTPEYTEAHEAHIETRDHYRDELAHFELVEDILEKL